MKFLITAIIIATFCFPAKAQTNLIEQLQITDAVDHIALEEKGNNYYIITRKEAGSSNPFLSARATEYTLNKYNKYTHQKGASIAIAGDTLQNDSIVVTYPLLSMRDNKIHLLYSKARFIGGTKQVRQYYRQLDTVFNTIVPEKRIDEMIGPYTGGFVPMDNGNVVLCYISDEQPVLGTSKYLILDAAANVIANDTVGNERAQGGYNQLLMRELVALPNNRLLTSGHCIQGGACMGPFYFGWNIVNDSMRILDTFTFHHGLETDTQPYKYATMDARMIGLPSGSLIASGNYQLGSVDVNSRLLPIIIKLTEATRYGVDDYIAFPATNRTDSAHGTYSAIRSMAYNPFDNNIYSASVSHMGSMGLGCGDNSDKSYLDIVSVDTNLNLRWRKFIRMNGLCSLIGTVSVPDGRNGILVMGQTYQADETFTYWVYYINDSTPSDNPTNVNDVAIKKEDGFVLYPVPAEDEVNLISLDKEFKEATLYDLSGRLLFTQSIISGRAVINTSQISPGIYMVKATDKKGNTFQKKMVKR